jgi:hypothetical protein
LNVESSFLAWYQTLASQQFGSLFTVTIPFTLAGDVVAPGTYAYEWEIVSVSEEREVGPAALQGLVGHVEFDPAIPPLGEQLLDQRHQALCGALVQPCEESLACGKVDRASVVRVDQAIIPQFGPLVKIRDARCGALKEGLRQGVDAVGRGQHARRSALRW